MIFKYLNFGLTISLLTLFLISCGGDDGSSSGATSGTQVTATDPYINGAKFCYLGADNTTGICDDQSEVTDGNGIAFFNGQIPEGATITTSEYSVMYSGTGPGKIPYSLLLKTKLRSGYPLIASPLTTILVNDGEFNTSSAPSSSTPTLYNTLKAAFDASPTVPFNLNVDDLYKDPMINTQLLIASMAINQAIVLKGGDLTTRANLKTTDLDPLQLKQTIRILASSTNSPSTFSSSASPQSLGVDITAITNLAANISTSTIDEYIDVNLILINCPSTSTTPCSADAYQAIVNTLPSLEENQFILVYVSSGNTNSSTATYDQLPNPAPEIPDSNEDAKIFLVGESKGAQEASSHKLHLMFHSSTPTINAKSFATAGNWTLNMPIAGGSSQSQENTSDYFTNVQFNINTTPSDFSQSIAAAVNEGAGILCIWAEMHTIAKDTSGATATFNLAPPYGDGFLMDGSYSATMTSTLFGTIKTECKVDSPIPNNAIINYVVKSISGSSFNKQISIQITGTESGSHEEYFKVDSQEIKYGADGGDQGWRVMFSYDKNSQKSSFEDVGVDKDDPNKSGIRRAFIDNENNTANIMANDSEYSTTFTIAGRTSGDKKHQLSQTTGDINLNEPGALKWMEDCIDSNQDPSVATSTYGGCGIVTNQLVYESSGNPRRVFAELDIIDPVAQPNWNCIDANSNLAFDSATLYGHKIQRGYCGTSASIIPPAPQVPAAQALIDASKAANAASVDVLHKMFHPVSSLVEGILEGILPISPEAMASNTNAVYWDDIPRFKGDWDDATYTYKTQQFFTDLQFNKLVPHNRDFILTLIPLLTNTICDFAVIHDYNGRPFGSDGFLQDGTYPGNWSQALFDEIKNKCGGRPEYPTMGQYTYVVSSITGSTFSKKIVVSTQEEDGTPYSQDSFFKITETEFNTAVSSSIEGYREMFFQDKTNKTVRYELASNHYNDGYYWSSLWRVFINKYDNTLATTNIMYKEGTNDRFTLAGNINGSGGSNPAQISMESIHLYPTIMNGTPDIMEVCVNLNANPPNVIEDYDYCQGTNSNVRVTDDPPKSILDALSTTLTGSWACLNGNSSPVFTNGNEVYTTQVKTDYCSSSRRRSANR